MLKKVYKTILILTITLGLTIPTNAAVSVSDGSAFVTNKTTAKMIQHKKALKI